jgi:hypothetical protein
MPSDGTNCHRFFHVVHRVTSERSLFEHAKDYRVFLGTLGRALVRRRMSLLGFTILPNGWEIVTGPVDTRTLCDAIDGVAGAPRDLPYRGGQLGSTPYVRATTVRPIIAARDLVRTCRRVERRSIDTGLVTRAEDWPWCSLARRLAADTELPLISTPFLVSATWRVHVNGLEPGSSADAANHPGRLALGAERRQDLIRVVRRTRDHEPDTHVERSEHLRVGDLTGPLQPGKDGRNRPARAV